MFANRRRKQEMGFQKFRGRNHILEIEVVSLLRPTTVSGLFEGLVRPLLCHRQLQSRNGSVLFS